MDNMFPTNKDTSIQKNSDTDPLKKYNKIYSILAALGGVIFFIGTFNPIGAILGALLGLGLAWIIVSAIAMSKVMKLNFTKYPILKNITEKELFESLVNNFSSPDIKIEKGFLGISINYKNVTVHRIELNESKRCYSINSTMSFKSKVKNGFNINSKKLYRNSFQTLPIIHKMIEESVNQINDN